MTPHRITRTGVGSLPRRAGTLAALLLLALLAARASPLPEGALHALWQSAGDLRALKSYAASVQAYERLAALTPTDPAPLLTTGDIYLAQRRWPLAADAFNRALARRMDLGSAWAGLASASWGAGHHAQATTQWLTALDHQPDLMPASLGLALAYLEQDRPAEAQAILRAGLSSSDAQHSASPRERDGAATAHLLLAAMLALDDSAGARRELSAIPADAPAPTLARQDYLRQTLERATAAASSAQAAKQLGLAFAQAQLWPLARAALARALELDPADAEAMAFLGHAEAQSGRPAWEHLNRAVVVRPGWPIGHYLLGMYYLTEDRPDAAAVQLRATTRMDPGNAQALLDLSHAYVIQGKYVEAEEALNAAVTADPRDLRFRMALASFYTDSSWQAADRGLAAAQAAADLAPQDARARDLLGWVYFLAGDLSQAHLQLVSALGLDPDLASTYFHLGKVYAALGLPEQARFAYLRAVDLDTDGGIRERAQQALSEMSHNTTPY